MFSWSVHTRQWPEVPDSVALFCMLHKWKKTLPCKNLKRVTQIIYLRPLPRTPHITRTPISGIKSGTLARGRVDQYHFCQGLDHDHISWSISLPSAFHQPLAAKAGLNLSWNSIMDRRRNQHIHWQVQNARAWKVPGQWQGVLSRPKQYQQTHISSSFTKDERVCML